MKSCFYSKLEVKIIIKLKLFYILLVIAMILVSGCNAATRQFGGEQTINLPSGKKLVNVTWKEDHLWILTKDMSDEDRAEKYQFTEDSNLGLMEGTVYIIESK